MKLYAVTIKPLSPFGTPLKGDTLFGIFCWQAAEDPSLLQGGLDHWIARYKEKPFAVFSSAWPQLKTGGWAIRRPELPMSWLQGKDGGKSCKEKLNERKQNKARKWLTINERLEVNLSWEKMVNDRDLTVLLKTGLQQENPLDSDDSRKLCMSVEQQHNSINRETNTTGKGFFAPYSMPMYCFLPGVKLTMFVLLDEEALTAEQLRTGMERIGSWGFGRDASTGLGRFSVEDVSEQAIMRRTDADSCLTLGPCVPGADEFANVWFSPFTRFGRHGAHLLHTGKPFKNPVVMADEGAVFRPRKEAQFQRPYLGTAVTGISKALASAVCQGYTIYLPMKLPVEE